MIDAVITVFYPAAAGTFAWIMHARTSNHGVFPGRLKGLSPGLCKIGAVFTAISLAGAGLFAGFQYGYRTSTAVYQES